MERPLGSCPRCCLAVLVLLPALSLAQYESWPSSLQYPEYFQQPAPEYQQPQVPSDVVKIQLRLAGQKRKHSEGRVEVYYDGQWGTVCDDDFSIHAAHVVCRELGYVEAKSWTASSSYGRGEGPIWLDNVYCTGKEATLAACTSNGWGVTDCKHTEDVGVVCSDKRIPGFKFDNSVFNQIEAEWTVREREKGLPFTVGSPHSGHCSRRTTLIRSQEPGASLGLPCRCRAQALGPSSTALLGHSRELDWKRNNQDRIWRPDWD